MERIKTQDFCVNVMKKRHESDLESTKDLECYANDHLYVDAMDNTDTKYRGPVSQYRSFLVSYLTQFYSDIAVLKTKLNF